MDSLPNDVFLYSILPDLDFESLNSMSKENTRLSELIEANWEFLTRNRFPDVTAELENFSNWKALFGYLDGVYSSVNLIRAVLNNESDKRFAIGLVFEKEVDTSTHNYQRNFLETLTTLDSVEMLKLLEPIYSINGAPITGQLFDFIGDKALEKKAFSVLDHIFTSDKYLPEIQLFINDDFEPLWLVGFPANVPVVYLAPDNEAATAESVIRNIVINGEYDAFIETYNGLQLPINKYKMEYFLIKVLKELPEDQRPELFVEFANNL